MASPTSYTRGTNFTDAQTASPATPLSGPAVDAEFDRIAITLASLIAALAQIQRADGELANASVGADQIDPAIYAGLQPATAWATSTDYVVNNTVFVSSGSDVLLYQCLVAHEATIFADDLAAGYWTLLADFTPPAVVGTIGVASGGTGATTASDARDNLGIGAVGTEDIVPVVKGGTGAGNASDARTALGLAIGSQVQAYATALAAIGALTPAADKLAYFTGTSAGALADLTAFARTLLDDANAAAARTTLGLGTAAVSALSTDMLADKGSTTKVPSVAAVQEFTAAAWVVFDGTGTPSILASKNVTSITDGGVGIYTVNFTNPMANTNYAAFGSGNSAQVRVGGSRTVNGVGVVNEGDTGTNEDSDYICVVVYGTLA